MAVETLKAGRDKVATPVTEIDENTLNWYATSCNNAKLKNIAKRELARRAGGGAAAPAQPSQALARQQDTGSLAIEGNFRDPSKATAALKAAAEAFHLISPAPMVGALPEGCALALALIRINPNDPHLYSVGGKVALDKTHLAQIANVVGASVVESRRTDDGSDPHYCAWTVTVRYRQFDGTWAYKPGSVEQDLREPFGAEYVDAVEKAANAKDRKGNPAPRDPRKQLGELRRFITRHAESKALNRAYAAIGIRRSYTPEELERPFCVARVVFTGQSDDPEARRQFREGIMRNFLSSGDEAYGPSEPLRSTPQLAPPPPMQDYSQPPTYDAEGEEYPPDMVERSDDPQQQPGASQPGTFVNPEEM